MATNFSANQYENAFAGKRLQNWEVAATFKERPSHLNGYTKPIADNRGHLVDGIPRSQKCPWGGFLGTWDSKENQKQVKTVIDGERLTRGDNSEILTIHSPPATANKKNIQKLISPVPQAFDEKDIGISKHLKELEKNETKADEIADPQPSPRTAERTPSPTVSNDKLTKHME